MSAFQIFTQPSQQALDTAANVLSGATLTFTLTGTNTPTNAFSDSSLVTPAANPLSANSAGVFIPVFLDPTVIYRVVLKTSAGAVLQTWDPANEQILSAALIGFYLYPRTAAEVSANVTPVNYAYAPGDVRRNGADPSGVTDSSSAIQAALNSNSEVWLEGTFKASNLSMTADGQKLFATSRGSGITALNNTQPVITMSGNRQVVQGIDFRTGVLATNDSQPNFCAVKITGTRCLVQSVATGGIFAYGIRFASALYSRLTDSNIDGWRKRAVSIEGGSFTRIDNNMLFDGSLTAPAEAIVYVDSAASTWISRNHITRGTGKGIYAVGVAPLNQLLTIDGNDIDFLENWAIDTDGYWNVHIDGNWCAGGQNSAGTPTGQIRIQNANRIYVNDNDTDGALQAGSRAIYVYFSSYGEIAGNTCQYTDEGIVVDSCNYILVHDNVSGQLTGLPPTGTPTTYCFRAIGLTLPNHVHWQNNIGYNPTTAVYFGVPATTIVEFDLFSADTTGGLSPTTDNAWDLGTPSFRWQECHSAAFYPGPGASGVFWTAGTGSPEGVVTAPVGSLWSRTNGGAGTSLYIKETGSGNTGWVGK